MATTVPPIRIKLCNNRPLNHEGDFVLYWMIANRRIDHNYSLQRAIEWCIKLKKPLVILEALRINYPWASQRLHKFVIDGMKDNANAVELEGNKGVLYYPYLEPKHGDQTGLLESLSQKACAVVTDDFPCFFIPAMIRLASNQIPVLFEKVDSNGILPLHSTDRVFTTAFSFRAYLHNNLKDHFGDFPKQNPIAGIDLPKIGELSKQITNKWPSALPILKAKGDKFLEGLYIDHSVKASFTLGGTKAAKKATELFLKSNLIQYKDLGNEPDENVRSGLSPYLHFGHISSHYVFKQLAKQEGWNPSHLSAKGGGKREGWWNMSPAAESFLDELITWREIGYNMCSKRLDYDRYDSLPSWAKDSLKKHTSDKRPFIYSLDEFQACKTHDALWNAAQNQLNNEGRIHNYLRMLWGKKILEWCETPQEALKIMVELNNKLALDGRNPNSYSGIFWVLGRYDRPWGPERPIFGSIRFMSSVNTQKKLNVKKYLAKYGVNSNTQGEFNFSESKPE
jgi:deoxyribodipyrimidine photo-lyase